MKNSLLEKTLSIEVTVLLFYYKNISYSKLFYFLKKKMCSVKGNNSIKPEYKGNPKYYNPMAIFIRKQGKRNNIMTSNANARRFRFPSQSILCIGQKPVKKNLGSNPSAATY